jgi:non-heme chloroperoxidase
VFIPGWTGATKVFERQFKHFEGSSRFRAIAYDPRGQGLSSKTLDGHTYQQHGRDLAAFIEKLL